MTVPFIGPRGRYNILGVNPSWVIHQMDGGAALNGAAPRTATTAADDLDPKVSAGKAEFGDSTTGLTEGGLFTLLGNYKQPMEVLAVDNAGSATITIVDETDTTLRTPPSPPFKVSPGEYVKASGGANGSKIGLLVKIDGEKIL